MIDEIAKGIERLGKLIDNFSGVERISDFLPSLSSSPSPSKMSEKYCCACLQRHLGAAIHFVNEAKRFGRKEKLREAFVEISGAESEIERAEFKDEEVRRRMQEILREMRDARLRLARGEAVDLNPLLEKAMDTCNLYIKREQREEVKEALSRLGVEREKIEEATDVILKGASGEIEMEDASEKLREMLGWKKLELKWDEKKGLILRGEKE